MRATMLAAVLLVLTSCVKSEKEVSVTGARVTEAGIYSARLPRDPSTSGVVGATNQGLDQLTLVQGTTNIPARLGTTFGFRCLIQGTPTNAPVVLTVIGEHPPLRNPKTGQSQARDEYQLESRIGETRTSYSLDEQWKLAPGLWRFEVWHKDRKLCEQGFVLVPDTVPVIASKPEPTNAPPPIRLETNRPPSVAADTNRFSDPTLGLSVVKPRDWIFLTIEQHAENLKRTTLKDAELMKELRDHPTAPLVGMMKYPEPFEDINPNLRISVVPLGSARTNDLPQVLSVLVALRQTNFNNFKLLVPPKNAKLFGRMSAYTKFFYDLEVPDGRRFPDWGELWLVPHKRQFFIIALELRQDEKTGKRAEFDQILESLTLD